MICCRAIFPAMLALSLPLSVELVAVLSVDSSTSKKISTAQCKIMQACGSNYTGQSFVLMRSKGDHKATESLLPQTNHSFNFDSCFNMGLVVSFLFSCHRIGYESHHVFTTGISAIA